MHTETKPAGFSGGQRLLATDWKPEEKNTRRGFFSIVTPHGFKINGATLYESYGSRWVGLPYESRIKPDGSMRYVEVIEFKNRKARRRFCDAALHALEELLNLRPPSWP